MRRYWLFWEVGGLEEEKEHQPVEAKGRYRGEERTVHTVGAICLDMGTEVVYPDHRKGGPEGQDTY